MEGGREKRREDGKKTEMEGGREERGKKKGKAEERVEEV